MTRRGHARDEIEAFVIHLAQQHTGTTVLVQDTLTELGLDSLTMAELIGVLEQRFHVQMDADIMDVDTVQELVEYINDRC